MIFVSVDTNKQEELQRRPKAMKRRINDENKSIKTLKCVYVIMAANAPSNAIGELLCAWVCCDGDVMSERPGLYI